MHRSLVLVVLGSCATETREPIEVSAALPLPIELQAGDIVHAGELALVVPASGETVGVSAHRDDGTTSELVIENPIDGVVVLVDAPAREGLPLEVLASTTACTDGAFALEGFHWASDYHWAFQAASTPAANSATNVAAGLQVAANAITRSRNDCGLADRVSATQSYAGTTTHGPDIANSTTAISCGTRDGSNVVGFGVLPSTYLAVTCYWYSNKVALEADIKINRNHHWFAGTVPAGCSGSFGIEQVGTHEFGHAFGLGHVAQSTHGTQTMSPVSLPCTNSKVTLGLGDVKGLRALY